MMHGQISRTYAKAFLAIVTIGMAGACADSSVAPTAEVPAFTAPANFARVGNSIVFRVNNSEGITKRLGKHAITIPAGAICDLTTSGYGTTSWDKPCSPLKGSVVITATVLQDGDGQPYVDFQPAMRFAPSKEVVLFLRQGSNTAKKQLTVEFCDNLGFCADESLNDASLKPFRIGTTSILGRRLKHFSGYAIIAGGECQGQVSQDENGNYICDSGSGMTRKSGYMVASGEDVADVLKEDKDKKSDEQ